MADLLPLVARERAEHPISGGQAGFGDKEGYDTGAWGGIW